MTLAELLEALGGQVELCDQRDGYRVAVVVMPAERRLLATERDHRQGIKLILDPTDEETHQARDGDLHELWESERASPLYGLVTLKPGEDRTQSSP